MLRFLGKFIFIGCIAWTGLIIVSGYVFGDAAQQDRAAKAFPMIMAGAGFGAFLWFIGWAGTLAGQSMNKQPKIDLREKIEQAEQEHYTRPTWTHTRVIVSEPRDKPTAPKAKVTRPKRGRPADDGGDPAFGTINFDWKDSDNW